MTAIFTLLGLLASLVALLAFIGWALGLFDYLTD